MRISLSSAALLAAVVAPLAANAQINELDVIRNDTSASDIARMRSNCALGLTPKSLAILRSAGRTLPRVSTWCVTVLSRAGRDGALDHVRDPRSDDLTPALAFDNGFVSGYLNSEALPQGAPAMATLLPIADRCLEQQERNTEICNAAGMMLGIRAARGERPA